jgi:type III pantothenate kinase
MLLAIDGGNTNTVFAVMNGDGTVRARWRAAADAKRTADEYAVWLTQLMTTEGVAPGDIDAAIIATVVPDSLYALKTLCAKTFGTTPLVVGEGAVDLGLDVLLENPAEVGADRLVNAVAAFETYGGPLIVVDFGTATTFDVIDKQGAYAGGVIAPGIHLSVEALYMAAARLPRIKVERPDRVIGNSTVSAMQSGVFFGYVAMVEGLAQRIKGEFGFSMDVVATGGLAELFTGATDVIRVADADLTARGLFLIHRRNVA